MESHSAKARLPAEDRRNLLYFCLIAYGITWVLWIPSIIHFAASNVPLPALEQFTTTWSKLAGLDLALAVSFQLAVYGPAIAALATLLLRCDRAEFKAWVRRLLKLTVAPQWYLFVVGAPIALGIIVAAAGVATGGRLILSGAPALGSVATIAILQMLTSGMEEPGWRGFALPILQRTHSAENASWYLGLIWAGWHLPYLLYLYRDLPFWQLPLTLAGFGMSIIAMAYVHAWLYNSTGSLGMNVILHGWANTTNAIVAMVIQSPIVPLATAGVTWLFVAWLLRKYSGQSLSAVRHA